MRNEGGSPVLTLWYMLSPTGEDGYVLHEVRTQQS